MPKVEIPNDFRCAITQQIYFYCITTSDEQSYEKEAIENWLVQNNNSPRTGKLLVNKNLTINQFADFLAKNIIQDDTLRDEVYFPRESMIKAILNHDILTISEIIRRDELLMDGKTRFLTEELCEVLNNNSLYRVQLHKRSRTVIEQAEQGTLADL